MQRETRSRKPESYLALGEGSLVRQFIVSRSCRGGGQARLPPGPTAGLREGKAGPDGDGVRKARERAAGVIA